MKSLVAFLVVLLALLSYRLLFGDGSVQELSSLHREVREARDELAILKNRNQSLRAEVQDLKNGLDAVEERARIELGMIGPDETFFQFVGNGKLRKTEGTDSGSSTVPNSAPNSTTSPSVNTSASTSTSVNAANGSANGFGNRSVSSPSTNSGINSSSGLNPLLTE